MVQGCSMTLLLIPLLWGIGFATLFLCLEQLSYFQKKIALLQFWFPLFEHFSTSTFSLLLWDRGNRYLDKMQQFPHRQGGQGTWQVTSASVTLLGTLTSARLNDSDTVMHSKALGRSWCLAPAFGCDGRHMSFARKRLTPCSAGQSSGWAQGCCVCATLQLLFGCYPNVLNHMLSTSVGRSLCSVNPPQLVFGSWSLGQVSVDCDQSFHCTIPHTGKLKCVCFLCWDILQQWYCVWLGQGLWELLPLHVLMPFSGFCCTFMGSAALLWVLLLFSGFFQEGFDISEGQPELWWMNQVRNCAPNLTTLMLGNAWRKHYKTDLKQQKKREILLCTASSSLVEQSGTPWSWLPRAVVDTKGISCEQSQGWLLGSLSATLGSQGCSGHGL